MDRERPGASDSDDRIPEAWIGQEVMIETTEVLSNDLRAGAPVYLEDPGVHERFLHAGAAEVLSKDVPFGEVLAAVRRLGGEG